MKIAARVTKRMVLTKDSFKRVLELASKASMDFAQFDAQKSPASELRKKLETLYLKLVELHCEEEMSKIEMAAEAALCFGFTYEFDCTNRLLTCRYQRTKFRKITTFKLFIETEDNTVLHQALKDIDPHDINGVDKTTHLISFL